MAGLEATMRKMVAADRFSGAVPIASDGQVLFRRAYRLADRKRSITRTASR
jgi:hypothetical protein